MVFLKWCSLIELTPTEVFSCEYWEIFKNTYFEEHLQTVASSYKRLNLL